MQQVFPFPPIVEFLPEAHLEVEGLQGWRIRTERGLLIFMATDREIHVPEHHHDAQWGVVLEGKMELVIEGERHVYQRGDTHYIPAGVEHAAILYAGWRGLYLFTPKD